MTMGGDDNKMQLPKLQSESQFLRWIKIVESYLLSRKLLHLVKYDTKEPILLHEQPQARLDGFEDAYGIIEAELPDDFAIENFADRLPMDLLGKIQFTDARLTKVTHIRTRQKAAGIQH